ncbi:MAG: hypothetical protein BWY76_02280 [bacterium ADurb.Bin429]|nr:MAG: hypothetical protein BWY76_02280 [bacterium ADurb.Bin429]
MRYLLWKEWQERRLWLLLWLLAMLGMALVGKGPSPFGFDVPAGWAMIPALFALLSGLAGYGSELVGGRAPFLFSRPVGWGRVLLAKVLPGVAVTLLGAILGAVAQRLTLPAHYHPFVTPLSLTLGALGIGSVMLAVYLIGLACSTTLRGLAGAALALLLWLALIIAGVLSLESQSDVSPAWTFFGGLAGLPLAGLVLARFGLTLAPGVRLARFALLLCAPIILGVLLDLTPANTLLNRPSTDVLVSPSGRHAIVRQQAKNSEQSWWVTLDDGTRLPLPLVITGYQFWLPNDRYLTAEYDDAPQRTGFLCWYEKGRIVKREFPLDAGRYLQARDFQLSPDGRYLLYGADAALMLLNIATGDTCALARLDAAIRAKFSRHASPYRRFWWQDAATVGYLDPVTEKRTLVAVR